MSKIIVSELGLNTKNGKPYTLNGILLSGVNNKQLEHQYIDIQMIGKTDEVMDLIVTVVELEYMPATDKCKRPGFKISGYIPMHVNSEGVLGYGFKCKPTSEDKDHSLFWYKDEPQEDIYKIEIWDHTYDVVEVYPSEVVATDNAATKAIVTLIQDCILRDLLSKCRGLPDHFVKNEKTGNRNLLINVYKF